MNYDNPTDFVSWEEIGARLKKSTRSSYRAAERGDIPSFRIGNRWYIPRESFEALLRGDRVMPGRGRAAVGAHSAAAATA